MAKKENNLKNLVLSTLNPGVSGMVVPFFSMLQILAEKMFPKHFRANSKLTRNLQSHLILKKSLLNSRVSNK